MAREAGGSTGEVFVLCDVDDPQEVIVVMGWRDLAQARLFIQSVSWQRAMKKMGMVGEAEVKVLG